jgi:hypothetical protein
MRPMKKFKTLQANLADPETEAAPLLSAPHVLSAVFSHYIPLPLVLSIGALSAALAWFQQLPLAPVILCAYLAVSLSSLFYMLRYTFYFQAHAQALQGVHYAFAGHKRYPILMALFALLLSASLGVSAFVFALLLVSLGLTHGRKHAVWNGALALAGSACFSLSQLPADGFQDPGKLLNVAIFFALWVLMALNPGFFKILRPA